jgi:hypothetical protein
MASGSIVTPPEQHEQWHLVVAKSASEARQGTAPLLAATGLIIWLIENYAFHNNMPLPVSAALWTLVPAAIGYLGTHVTVKKVTL